MLRRATCALVLLLPAAVQAAYPVRSHGGMVVAQERIAAEAGAAVLRDGGSAVDAAIATCFALAVTHPTAGNVGGGGFLVYRPVTGDPVAYDFRETAPAGASATMFLKDGRYDEALHHDSYLSVGVPGTVAGLHIAWKAHGTLPWRRLVAPAIALARDGLVVSDGLAESLREELPVFRKVSPAALAQFSHAGTPYAAGEVLRQPELARTLERIAASGPAGFYQGETAELVEREMKAHGGLITRADLAAYTARVRTPVKGTYRGYEVIGMPPPSSGGTAVIEALNLLEGDDLAKRGFGSAATVHLVAESLRRAFADRARFQGDPDANADLPIARLTSKEYAAGLRKTIREDRASVSTPTSFTWDEGMDTTHVSVVDATRNAVALTFTLEDGYGSRIVVPGAGFLLNNEMGDFNAGPGLTDATGLVGTQPNLAAPGKRMLSSMSPTIVSKGGQVFMVTGSPGGRTIISTVLETILDVIDFGMNVQDAIDAPRFHHQWLPDRILYEKRGLSPDTLALLAAKGHALMEIDHQGAAEAIVYDAQQDVLEGGFDRRAPDSAAVPQPPKP